MKIIYYRAQKPRLAMKLLLVLFGANFLFASSAVSMDMRAGEYLAARYAGATSDLTNAAAYYDAVLAVDPDNSLLISVASLFFLADGQVQRAIELSERLAGENDLTGTAGLLAAMGAAKNGNYPQASQFLNNVPRIGLNRLMAPLVLSWTLVGEGKVNEAIEVLDVLGGNLQYAPFENYMKALIYTYTNNIQLAETSFRDALNGGAGSRQVEAYGNFLEQQNQIETAISVYESFLDVQFSTPIQAALLRIQSGSSTLPLINSVNDGLAEVFYTVAISLSQESASNAARNFARMASYLRKDFDSARMILSETMEQEGANESALSTLKEIKSNSIFYWESRMNIALLLGKLDRLNEAITLLQGMTAERPQSNEALTTLGDIYRMNEQFVEASIAYSEAIDRIDQIEPRHWGLFYTRGTTYERSNQWSLAEADFLKALELQPDQPFVLNYLGYSWIDMGINIEEATQMIIRAVEQQPAAGFIVDSLGWGYYKLGKYQEATKELERALQLTPAEPTINDHLGDAYWKVGRKREAVFQWQRALDLGIDEASIAVIKDKIVNGLSD